MDDIQYWARSVDRECHLIARQSKSSPQACFADRLSWKLDELSGGSTYDYHLAKQSALAKHAVPCNYRDKQVVNFQQAYCEDPAFETARLQLEAEYDLRVVNELNSSGKVARQFSENQRNWVHSRTHSYDCVSEGELDKICVAREIEWRIGELRGEKTVYEQRAEYVAAQEAESERQQAEEAARTRLALKNHQHPLARAFGNCTDLSAWGRDVYCDGNKIATVDEVKAVVSRFGLNNSGRPISDLDKRKFDAAVNGYVNTYAITTSMIPDPTIRAQYGNILYIFMGMVVRK